MCFIRCLHWLEMSGIPTKKDKVQAEVAHEKGEVYEGFGDSLFNGLLYEGHELEGHELEVFFM